MIKNIHNNAQVLQQIEWPILEKSLKDSCYFDQSFKSLLVPLESKESIRTCLANSAKFHQFLEQEELKDLIHEYSSDLDSE